MSAATAIDQTFEAKAIGTVLEAAVVQVLQGFGLAHGLTPIAWTVVDYPEGPVVEGRPVTECKDAELICTEWASALEMVEYDWDAVDGERSWRLDIGSWHLELIACHDRAVNAAELFD